MRLFSFIRRIYFSLLYPGMSIAKTAYIGRGLIIRMETERSEIVIEENVYIGNRVVLGSGPGKIKIGSNTIIRDNCIISAAADVLIGSDVYIDKDVSIRTGNHGYSNRYIPYNQQPPDSSAILIDSGATIENTAVILGGAHIEEERHISKGSVMTSRMKT